MTTQTTIADRATVPQILADLILLGQRASLPDPIDMHASQGNGIATIELDSRENLHAWLIALGGAGIIHTQAYGHNRLLHNDFDLINRRGWRMSLSAVTSAPESAPLDAETVAELEAVVAAPPVKSIPKERVDEILAELNRLTKDPDANGREPDWWDWLCDGVSEFDAEATSDSSPSTVVLVDGTTLIWHQYANSWTRAGGYR